MSSSPDAKIAPLNRSRRFSAATLHVLLGLVVVSAVGAAPPHGGTGRDPCVRHDVRVEIGARTADVAAWLCGRGNLAGRTVQVLVPGTTYTHTYWDFPYEPDRYSYARHAVARGYAVLTYDRVGTGQSTIPPAVEVTYEMHINVLHQLVSQLRAGDIGGVAFPRVVTVGHSQGAFIAVGEAQLHDDVDAVISTGILHTVNPLVGPHARDLFWPAVFDPEHGDTAPPGYATTPPGTREAAFYHAPNTDPQVVAIDEATKTIASYGELTMARAMAPYVGVDVPVLSVVGERDALFCPLADCAPALATAHEASMWPDAESFELVLLPETGHDINLHLTSREWFDLAADWLDATSS